MKGCPLPKCDGEAWKVNSSFYGPLVRCSKDGCPLNAHSMPEGAWEDLPRVEPPKFRRCAVCGGEGPTVTRGAYDHGAGPLHTWNRPACAACLGRPISERG